ncbi:hypothetical protein BGZ58_006912 [Dissophora ornata]|nr:hypothetical protein BGZ58_010480 [Dissophora ornata]KAF8932602.1 hypothetical protein BGZ58_006912 [Dissophora ornata]
MVKIFSAVAVVLAAAIGSAQAAYVLSSGYLYNTHRINGVSCGSTSYETPATTLKAGKAWCSYLFDYDMTVCQCHQADVSTQDQLGFLSDIISNVGTLGACVQNSGSVDFTNAGTWINGYYRGNNWMSAAGFNSGRNYNTGCKPVGCSKPSQNLSWRNLKTVSTTC